MLALLKSENSGDIFNQVKYFIYLFASLLFCRTNNVRICEAKSAHSLEAHKLAGLFKAIQLGQFRYSHRELSVTARAGEIKLEVVRACHRSEHEFLILHLNGREH